MGKSKKTEAPNEPVKEKIRGAKIVAEPVRESTRTSRREEHTNRILAKSLEDRKFFLFYAKYEKCWSHIDWDRVKESIEKEEKKNEHETKI